jgi:hypothetical protein
MKEIFIGNTLLRRWMLLRCSHGKAWATVRAAGFGANGELARDAENGVRHRRATDAQTPAAWSTASAACACAVAGGPAACP